MAKITYVEFGGKEHVVDVATGLTVMEGARDNGIPFYVALPSPTIDFSIDDGVRQIPIEQRAASEVTHMTGRTSDGRIESVRVVPEGSPIANYGFDVTPARLVTGLITERGVLTPERAALANAFPERVASR